MSHRDVCPYLSQAGRERGVVRPKAYRSRRLVAGLCPQAGDGLLAQTFGDGRSEVVRGVSSGWFHRTGCVRRRDVVTRNLPCDSGGRQAELSHTAETGSSPSSAEGILGGPPERKGDVKCVTRRPPRAYVVVRHRTSLSVVVRRRPGKSPERLIKVVWRGRKSRLACNVRSVGRGSMGLRAKRQGDGPQCVMLRERIRPWMPSMARPELTIQLTTSVTGLASPQAGGPSGWSDSSAYQSTRHRNSPRPKNSPPRFVAQS